MEKQSTCENLRSNEHWFSADNEEEWWTQCGDLSATKKAFYLPIVHPMVPIGNLSTTVDQHLGEPAKHRHRDVEVSSKILGERLGIFVAGACFFHIQFVGSKEEINLGKTGISWIQLKISLWNAFSQVFTPPPHSQWNQKGYIDTRPQCAFLSHIWKNQVRCIKPWK